MSAEGPLRPLPGAAGGADLASPLLVTGAGGFVGHALCAALSREGSDVVAAFRARRPPALRGVRALPQPALDAASEWRPLLEGCRSVVHLAALVHRKGGDPLAAYRTVNTAGTLNLARQAAAAGVRRFVFMSSVKVNGEGRDAPYDEASPPEPEDFYAVSKWEAEQGLYDLAARTGMQVVILRPPLIYGPGVGGNFLALLRVVDRALPLPLGAVRNRRSLLFLGNLVDATLRCLHAPLGDAACRTYLLSDGEDLSTPDLIRRLARQLHRPSRLLAVPPGLLALGARLSGQERRAARLLDSLCVDGGRMRRELGWSPPYSVDQGLRITADWFRGRGRED